MQHNRYIPYGYCVGSGMTIHPEEAETVRQIYHEYQNGKSYKVIAQQLADERIPFYEDRCDWNKNRVKRILENERYIGKNGYPQIIPEAEFKAVQEIIASHRPRDYMSPEETAIRSRIYCAECGKRYKRFASSAARAWWKCEDKECLADYKFTPDMLFSAVAAIIDSVIADPELLNVQTDENQGFIPNTETIRLNNEINRMLEKSDTSREELTCLILQGVSARYDACTIDATPHTTETLRSEYGNAECSGKLQPDLIDNSVSAIMVAHDGKIQIKFINGAIVNGTIPPGKEQHKC